MTRIYKHWRRCANGKAAAHRRRSNPGRPAINHDYFSGFLILRGSRQRAQKRRKQVMEGCSGNAAPARCSRF